MSIWRYNEVESRLLPVQIWRHWIHYFQLWNICSSQHRCVVLMLEEKTTMASLVYSKRYVFNNGISVEMNGISRHNTPSSNIDTPTSQLLFQLFVISEITLQQYHHRIIKLSWRIKRQFLSAEIKLQCLLRKFAIYFEYRICTKFLEKFFEIIYPINGFIRKSFLSVVYSNQRKNSHKNNRWNLKIIIITCKYIRIKSIEHWWNTIFRENFTKQKNSFQNWLQLKD